MANVLTTVRDRVVGLFRKGLEGPIPSWWPVNYWQIGLDRQLPWTGDLGANAAVEACVGAITQTVAMLPVDHWRGTVAGGQERVTNSAASRVLRMPNAYQTKADFFLNLLRGELLTGNGYALAVRNNRYEVAELHVLPPRSANPQVDAESGEIFYSVGNLQMLPADEQQYDFVPARDILHIRMHTPRDPLRGETPITAAMLSVSAGNAISQSQAAFFNNMSRPSGVIENADPKIILTQDQINQMRAKWLERSQDGAMGGIQILTQGWKWQPLTMTAADAQLAEIYKMTVADVARVYRVPLPIIGDMTGSTYNNVETLIRHWLSTGLGFVLEHLELALDKLFGLPGAPIEWTEFSTDGLLRSDFQARIDGLTKAVIGGVMSPNEAREREGLPAVEAGDEPRVQQQVVPLSAWEQLQATPPPPPPPEPDQTAAFLAGLHRSLPPCIPTF